MTCLGKKLDYIIYEKREILSTDLSCTSQETNGNIIVTLITCNNISGKRLQIKAKCYKYTRLILEYL